MDIKDHTADKPIYSYQLEEKYHVSGVVIRDAIHHMRTTENIPICSGSKGYFYPRDKAEVQRTINHLRSRAKRNREAAEGIERYYQRSSGQLELL
jgi:transcriptional regulator of NAD metabolism